MKQNALKKISAKIYICWAIDPEIILWMSLMGPYNFQVYVSLKKKNWKNSYSVVFWILRKIFEKYKFCGMFVLGKNYVKNLILWPKTTLETFLQKWNFGGLFHILRFIGLLKTFLVKMYKKSLFVVWGPWEKVQKSILCGLFVLEK